MQVRSGVLGQPSWIRVRIRNRFQAVSRAVVSTVMWFSNLLTVTVRSDPSAVRDLIPKISELDHNKFILVRVEVLNFRDHFRFSLEIFSLTSLSYFSLHTWLHLVFFLLSIIFILFNEKNKS